MAKQITPPDSEARREALHPSRSFIVQAPAGSGKTELLTQRFLNLLTEVEAPEEIVAITFTRKAAGEMRGRILAYLERAADNDPPIKEHRRATWEMARAVLEIDRKRGWNLIEAPSRLRILTIDALSGAITRRMPWRSGLGGAASINEDLESEYLEAARKSLEEIEKKSPAAQAAKHLPAAQAAMRLPAAQTVKHLPAAQAAMRLLAHLDNHLEKTAGLLTSMLKRRDQWLRHIASENPADLRANLEGALERTVREGLRKCLAALPPELGEKLAGLARNAANNLIAENSQSPIIGCQDLSWPISNDSQNLPKALLQWRGLAELLLTGEGTWRKAITKSQGFPPSSKGKDKAEKELLGSWKEGILEMLAALEPAEDFQANLQAVRELPPFRYSESQWSILEALLTLLPVAVENLRKIFDNSGKIDFIEVALSALTALKSSDGGDSLDYGIRHLLVDEFQDTSFSQYVLLESLTADWRPGDGRTLFLVGDPMQSIYRFRESEVGLYLKAFRQGIGRITLEQAALQVNFRSQRPLVEWLNQTFPKVLPAREDIYTGAVTYTEATASHDGEPLPPVVVHPALERDDAAEARLVVELVRKAQSIHPADKTAILVRSKSHLAAIAPRLRSVGLSFQAIDIDPLAERQTVLDLMALTLALHHPGDRVAWLALLRSPVGGMGLAELFCLAGHSPRETLWQAINSEERTAGLNPEARQRLERLREVMERGISDLGRNPIRRIVEGVWLEMGGAVGLAPEEIEEAQGYLDLLERLEAEGEAPDRETLLTQAGKLFSPPDPQADDTLQIMTIHKAKGLEFDTVILPGLGKRPRREDTSLLLWAEHPLPNAEGVDLLLGPIGETGGASDSIYDYIKELNKTKNRNETGRMLYVAITRAKKQVHLLGHTKVNDSGLRPPDKQSLLAQLWPAVKPDFQARLEENNQEGAERKQEAVDPSPGPPSLRRLKPGWKCPPPPPGIVGLMGDSMEETSPETRKVEFSWASETARRVGNVVHRMLQQMADSGLKEPMVEMPENFTESCRNALVNGGVAESELEEAIAKTLTALKNTLADERGRWLLDNHEDAASELALSSVLDGRVTHRQIDRTFVDEEGIRWIIDYKTGKHEGGNLEEFLDSEQKRYREQLENYARIMGKYDPHHPIKMGLYFPLHQEWRSWEKE